MNYNNNISEIRIGETYEGFYVARNVQLKTSAAGKPYLSLLLTDNSGAIDTKMWDYNGPSPSELNGNVVKVRGDVVDFKGNPQFNIRKMRVAVESDSFDLDLLIPKPPFNPDATEEYVEKLINSIADDDYRRLSLEFLNIHKSSFTVLPAAKSVHHSFRGGLLMHTSNMLKIADFLSGLYSDTVNRSLLLAGTFMHDLSKDREFALSSLGIATDYSVEGTLLSHSYMGAAEIATVGARLGIDPEKSMLLQHMVLSHHGEHEFGAAVLPCCIESELLSLIDRIDSRAEIYAEAFASASPGEMSDRIFALDRRIYNHE